MSITPSLNSLQQPHQLDGPSSEFHDQLCDLHDGGGTSPPSTSRQALPDVANPVCPGPPRPFDPSIETKVDPPSWERLIRSSVTAYERVFLITAIFSNRDEVEVVKRLRGGDAQIFVDAIYEARSYVVSSSKNELTNFDSNPRAFSIRRWIISITCYG